MLLGGILQKAHQSDIQHHGTSRLGAAGVANQGHGQQLHGPIAEMPVQHQQRAGAKENRHKFPDHRNLCLSSSDGSGNCTRHLGKSAAKLAQLALARFRMPRSAAKLAQLALARFRMPRSLSPRRFGRTWTCLRMSGSQSPRKPLRMSCSRSSRTANRREKTEVKEEVYQCWYTTKGNIDQSMMAPVSAHPVAGGLLRERGWGAEVPHPWQLCSAHSSWSGSVKKTRRQEERWRRSGDWHPGPSLARHSRSSQRRPETTSTSAWWPWGRTPLAGERTGRPRLTWEGWKRWLRAWEMRISAIWMRWPQREFQ